MSNDALMRLALFGLLCLQESRTSYTDLDGGWLQEMAVQCGVLEEREVSESCGEDCMCEDFPTTCYFIPESAREVMDHVLRLMPP